MKKILLLWYMEDKNFGDTLIYETVSSFFLRHGFETESHEVGDSIQNIINHANQCDFMIFAGGGIIERGVPEVIREFKDNNYKLKIPYGVMGIGMGNFDYTSYYCSIKEWVIKSKFFYVRDENTKMQLNMISNVSKVVFSADCVFANKKLNKIRSSKRKNGHGINLRNIPYKDVTGDFNWEEINNILNTIECNIIIPDVSKEESNISIGVHTKKNLGKARILSRMEIVRMTIEEIEKCEWIVAMRFHVILVASILGILTVPLVYCPKVKYLAQQLGILDLAVELDGYMEIPNKIKRLSNDEKLYRNIIENNVNKMKKRAEKMFQEVLVCVEKACNS